MGGKWKTYKLSPLDRRILKNKIRVMKREMSAKINTKKRK